MNGEESMSKVKKALMKDMLHLKEDMYHQGAVDCCRSLKESLGEVFKVDENKLMSFGEISTLINSVREVLDKKYGDQLKERE